MTRIQVGGGKDNANFVKITSVPSTSKIESMAWAKQAFTS